MKIRKTAFMLIFAMICNLAMTGCGGSDEEQGRILIAYFSLTGNTREAAQMIADYTGGDLAEIKRAEEYGDLEEEAQAEIQDGIHPEITVSVSDVADYDTVFVGFPNMEQGFGSVLCA